MKDNCATRLSSSVWRKLRIAMKRLPQARKKHPPIRFFPARSRPPAASPFASPKKPERRLRLQFDVPVEIVLPALMQIVGREGAAILVQVSDGRAIGRLHRKHFRL